MTRKACILLEDGFYQEGFSLGAEGETAGEVVFNTSMSGYQEILTDPSYKGQIVCMTYPLIGNYGINYQDTESQHVQTEGLIIKERSKIASNFRSKISLETYLKENNIIGIDNLDTRAITRHLRVQGSMKGVISTVDFDRKSLKGKLDNAPSIVGRDLVREVLSKKIYEWHEPLPGVQDEVHTANYTVVVIDCGVKYSILRSLKSFIEKVIVVPADTSLRDILNLKPQGVLFSNGPGDPEAVTYAIDTAREIISGLKSRQLSVCVMGICLGHQILGLALGCKTYKLKFGHHGGNHPVKDLGTGKIDITAQNHNFCVQQESMPHDLENTHINLYDNTPEGMRHKSLPIFSVQFHPEAGPGPFDARYIFGTFRGMIESNQKQDDRNQNT